MDQTSNELPLEALADRNVGIKLIGVGGGGSNAVDRLKMENLDRLQLAVINTDLKALGTSPVQDKILIGAGLTRGLSAGGDPELGCKAAEADADKIAEIVKDTDLIFLVAGLGGGTGSGATPIVAQIAAEAGAVVIAFVTLPFSFEGGRRSRQAEEALTELRRVCDAVIPLSNDMLLQEGTEQTSVLDSFARADEWIGRGVKSIWAMLSRTGLINVDFTAVRQVFQHRGGKTLFGLGVGSGDNPTQMALEDLKNCPLLHAPDHAKKADRLLVNITGGADLSLTKVNEVMSAITEQFGNDAHVVMGAAIDEALQGRVEICVMGTTDVGSRNFVRRTGTTPPMRRSTDKPVASTTGVAAGSSANIKTVVTTDATPRVKTAATGAVHNNKPQQDEFGFQGEPAENRGTFEKSDRNLFEGQDLDVPTYLRKGIKVAL